MDTGKNLPAQPTAPKPAGISNAAERATNALILASVQRAHHLLHHGSPDTQLQMIRMFAGGAVKEAMRVSEETDSALMTEFHKMRDAMISGKSPAVSPSTEADITDAEIVDP